MLTAVIVLLLLAAFAESVWHASRPYNRPTIAD